MILLFPARSAASWDPLFVGGWPDAGGEHAVRWNGRSTAGVPAASGVYYYLLRTARENESRRMVLVK